MPRLRPLVFALLTLSCVAGAARADAGADLLARYKAASGAARWDALRSWHGDGTLSAGGLRGELHVTVDLRSGRSVDSYTLGALEGGDGYDGTHAWERDPGGEVAALDAPDSMRHARSQAWLDAHAYWFPQRAPSSLGKVETRDADGQRFQVLKATPRDGDELALWFDARGMLARSVQRQGSDSASTVYDDYRDAGGVRLPFHVVTDVTDAAGRTDPRRRTEMRFERIALDVPVADADFAMPQMSATARIDAAGGVTTIPFELINNHIYVDGRVDGKPAHFMLDTGGGNLLTPAAAKRLGLSSEGKLAMGGSGEDRVDVGLAHAGEVRIGGATLAKPVFYVLDLGQLAAVEGVDADGLVGYEMFRRFDVRIDYAARQVTLAEHGKLAPPPGATALPFTLDERTPIVEATLDGLPLRLSVDTGSRSSLTLDSPFVREHHLLQRYHAERESVVGWGVGGAARGNPARFGTLALGGLKIEGIAGELFTGNKGAFANPELGGNLGGGVLRRFTVGFDYTSKQMYLAPNAAFGTGADAFDRSGLWLLADGTAFKVVDVAPDSAAARAGVRPDDRVVAIGGAATGTQTLAPWRQRLREAPAGTKVTLRLERAGRTQQLTLTLADRIAAKFTP